MIDEATVKTEATKLREELKRGRQQRSDESRDGGTTEDHGGYDQSINGTTRSSVPVLQRTGATDGRRTRTIRRDGRSTIRSDGRFQGESEQPRSEHRRPYEQHPSFVTGSAIDATEGEGRGLIGNFQRQDEIPRRSVTNETQPEPPYTPREKRKPGRPRKIELEAIPANTITTRSTDASGTEEQPEQAKTIFQSVKSIIPSGKVRSVLNETEIKTFYPILKGALKDYGRYVDQYLNSRLSTAGTIWGNLDADELDNLVSAMLSIGKRNGTVAEGVRLVAHSNDYVTTVMILVPRLMQTTQVLQQAPPRPRKTVSERGERFRSRFRSRLGEKINE